MIYGLWQSETQVSSALEKMKSSAEKLKALKCQLLEQFSPKELFFMSKNRKKLSIDEVVANLLVLNPPLHSQTGTCFTLHCYSKFDWGVHMS